MLDSIRQQLVEPTKPFSMFLRVSLRADTVKAFETLSAEAATATLQEPGCIAYEFHAVQSKPESCILAEKWRSFDDLAAHFATPHVAKLIGWLQANEGAITQVDVCRSLAQPQSGK